MKKSSQSRRLARKQKREKKDKKKQSLEPVSLKFLFYNKFFMITIVISSSKYPISSNLFYSY